MTDHPELERLQDQLADAVSFIRVMGEELVLAGYSGGDRDHTLGNLRRLRAENEALRKALDTLGRWQHYSCEDTWYSCPKDPEGCANELAGTECVCGADEHNAMVDAALAARRTDGRV